jgi:amino acid transporter
MVWSVAINGATAFAFLVAVLYAITDSEAILSTGGLPILVAFTQATNNQKAATAMASGIIVIMASSLLGYTASIPRLIWA